MEEKSARYEKQSDNNRAKNRFQHPRSRKQREPRQIRNDVMQVSVAIVDHRIVIPRLTRPEPNPTRAPYECANDNQKNPLKKTGAKHPQRHSPLLDCVIAVS